MSDMIDGLSKAALEAGDDAAARLAADVTVAELGERVRRGRRRRRVVQAVAAAAGAAAVVALAFALPTVVPDRSQPITPAEETPLVVWSADGLSVFEDGSMAVETSAGAVVTFESLDAVTDLPFKALTVEQACALQASDFHVGWTYHAPDAHRILSSATPQVVYDGRSREPIAQGETIPARADGWIYPIALNVAADSRAAGSIGLRISQFYTWTDPTGASAPILTRFDSILDARPAVVADDGAALATIQSRPIADQSYYTYCTDEHKKSDAPYLLKRFLVVDVFLMDRRGTDILIASHTSWNQTEVHP